MLQIEKGFLSLHSGGFMFCLVELGEQTHSVSKEKCLRKTLLLLTCFYLYESVSHKMVLCWQLMQSKSKEYTQFELGVNTYLKLWESTCKKLWLCTFRGAVLCEMDQNEAKCDHILELFSLGYLAVFDQIQFIYAMILFLVVTKWMASLRASAAAAI